MIILPIRVPDARRSPAAGRKDTRRTVPALLCTRRYGERI